MTEKQENLARLVRLLIASLVFSFIALLIFYLLDSHIWEIVVLPIAFVLTFYYFLYEGKDSHFLKKVEYIRATTNEKTKKSILTTLNYIGILLIFIITPLCFILLVKYSHRLEDDYIFFFFLSFFLFVVVFSILAYIYDEYGYDI